MDAVDLMTGSEVAALFRVDIKTVYRWGLDGRLTIIKTPGGRARYLTAQVQRFYDRAQEKEIKP